MTDYTPNSHKYREEKKEGNTEKRIKKVVTGKTAVRKNSARKFTDIFIAEDASNVKSYIFMDVLVPAIKKAISDIVTDGVDMILYGESGRGKRKSSSGGNVSYRKYYDDPRDRSRESRSSSRFDYDDISFDRRSDAEAVLDEMREVLDTYGVVTIADMYEMADRTAPYTGNKYGWTSVRSAEVVHTRDGYIIKLPKAMPLD